MNASFAMTDLRIYGNVFLPIHLDLPEMLHRDYSLARDSPHSSRDERRGQSLGAGTPWKPPDAIHTHMPPEENGLERSNP